MTLTDRIRERIVVEGPLPFEVFQAMALYDPGGGFFTSEVLRSTKGGDFLTSPEVSPLFGAMLARFVNHAWHRIGRPGQASVVEVAAGSGSLLRPLLEGLEFEADAWAIEASPAACRALEGLGGVRVTSRLADLPERLTGVVLANELIDNLPVALAVRTGEGWTERFVGMADQGFALVDAPARPEVIAWADRFAGPVPQGGMVEVQLVAADWLTAILDRLQLGALLLIDYGDTADGLAPRRTQGTLRTYRSHHLGPDPLIAPGESDITVDVNFTALCSIAEEVGAHIEYSRQDDFLAGLGLRDELRALRREELNLAENGDAMARLRVRSVRSEAETLLHPRGLGDFRVLVARR